MAGNRYPNIESKLYNFYDKTSKSTIMEIARDLAIQLTGSEDIEKAIKILEERKNLLKR